MLTGWTAIQSWQTGGDEAAPLPQTGFFVDLEDLLGNTLPVVALGSRNACRAHPTPAGGVVQQGSQCPRPGRRIARGQQQALTPIADDLGEAGNRGGDHGKATGHRLEQHNAEALLASRWGAEDVGTYEIAWQHCGVDEPPEINVRDVASSNVTPASGTLRAVADEHQTHIAAHRSQHLVRGEQRLQSLALVQPAHEEQREHSATAQTLMRRPARGEACRVYPVGNDVIVARKVAADMVARRHAHRGARVQPSEVAG